MCGKIDIWTSSALNSTVLKGIEALEYMKERGGVESDGQTGHGIGYQTDLPHKVFAKDAADEKSNFTSSNRNKIDFTYQNYAAGEVLLPKDKIAKDKAIEIIEKAIEKELGVKKEDIAWRTPPFNDSDLSNLAKEMRPDVRQLFFNKPSNQQSQPAFELALISAHLQIQLDFLKEIHPEFSKYAGVNSMSAERIVGKEPLRPEQITTSRLDLADPDYKTQSFSGQHRKKTNAELKPNNNHPYIFIQHNGEINNIEAITKFLESLLNEVKKVQVTVDRTASDTRRLDLFLATEVSNGSSLEKAIATVLRPAWFSDPNIDKDIKEFFQYHDTIKPPAVGPAFISAYDPLKHKQIFINDPSGDRDSIYEEYKDKKGLTTIVWASEFGLIPSMDIKDLKKKGQLGAGEIAVMDLRTGDIVRGDQVIKDIIAEDKAKGIDYAELNKSIIKLKPVKEVPALSNEYFKNPYDFARSFGVDENILDHMLMSGLKEGAQEMGAMNPHTTEPALSHLPYEFSWYKKQQAAQMTNRAGDRKNEGYLFSTTVYLGANRTKNPDAKNISTNVALEYGEYEALLEQKDVKYKIIDATFDIREGEQGKRDALKRIREESLQAVRDGAEIVILSDRNISKYKAGVEIEIAGRQVDQYLKDNGKRLDASLIADTARIITSHGIAMANSDGFNAINSYLGFALTKLKGEGMPDLGGEKALKNYHNISLNGYGDIIGKPGAYLAGGYSGSGLYYFQGIDNRSDPDMKYAYSRQTSSYGGHGIREFSQNAIACHLSAVKRYDPQIENEVITLDKEKDKYWKQTKILHRNVMQLTYTDPEADISAKDTETRILNKHVFGDTLGAEKKYWGADFAISYHKSYAKNDEADKILKAEIKNFLKNNKEPDEDQIKGFVNGNKNIQPNLKSLATYLIKNPDSLWIVDERKRLDIPTSERYTNNKKYTAEEIDLHHADAHMQKLNQAEYQLRQEQPKHIMDLLKIESSKSPVIRRNMGIKTSQYLKDNYTHADKSEGSIGDEASLEEGVISKIVNTNMSGGEGGKTKQRMPGGKFEDTNQNNVQVASGRFGVTIHYITSTVEGQEDKRKAVINFKISQGAKDGEGGALPGKKNTPKVANRRGVLTGTDQVSMPTPVAQYSVEDQKKQYEAFRPEDLQSFLKHHVDEIRKIDKNIEIAVKLVANDSSIETIVIAAAEAGANEIIIADGTGGTGAAKKDSIIHTGGNVFVNVFKAHNALVKFGYRDNLKVIASGGISSTMDATLAHACGADGIQVGKGGMNRVSGCVNAATCGTTCPRFITTEAEKHNESRRRGERETIYFVDETLNSVANLGYSDVRYGKENSICGKINEIAKQKTPEELEKLGIRGNFDFSFLNNVAEKNPLLERKEGISEYKKTKIPDIQAITLLPTIAKVVDLQKENAKEKNAATKIIEEKDGVKTANTNDIPEVYKIKLRNVPVNPNQIGIGKDLSANIAMNFTDGKDLDHAQRGQSLGKRPIPEGAVQLFYKGVPGHYAGSLSFGCNQYFECGNANAGIAATGGVLVFAPSKDYPKSYIPHENMIITNGGFYGATGGFKAVWGGAGRRYCQRFSEGAENTLMHYGDVQDNAYQYFTGGSVLWVPNDIKNTGRNLMYNVTGGAIAVYDPGNQLGNKDDKSKSVHAMKAEVISADDFAKLKLNIKGETLLDRFKKVTKDILDNGIKQLGIMETNIKPEKLIELSKNIEKEIGNFKIAVESELGNILKADVIDMKALSDYRDRIVTSNKGNTISPYTAMFKTAFLEALKFQGHGKYERAI